jgi:hypothetical protein
MTFLPPGNDLLDVLSNPQKFKERLDAFQSKQKAIDESFVKMKEQEAFVEKMRAEHKKEALDFSVLQTLVQADQEKVREEAKALNALADKLTDRETVVSILEKEAVKKLEELQIREGSLSKQEKDFQKRSDDLALLEAKANALKEKYEAKDKQLKEIANG